MTERPILFSAPMVRALLDGRKTQTRRVVKPQPDGRLCGDDFPARLSGPFIAEALWGQFLWPTADGEFCGFSPYGVPGDPLWVRESHALHERFTDVVRVVYSASLPGSWSDATREFPAHLAAGLKIKPFQQGWRPSIHMPRWASRITLRLTDVRVERLNEISEADAIAEGIERRLVVCADSAERNLWFGVPHAGHESAVQAYADLWDSINNPRGYCGEDEPHGWDANPWVWALSFERVEQAQRSAA